jgi:hypothetical protein
MYPECVQLRGFVAGLAVVTLVACGEVTVTSPDTTLDGATTIAGDVSGEDTGDDQAAATTTLPPETTTTTTTMPPTTTTTVLDVDCIKTTACQFANLVGADFSRLQVDFTDFSAASAAGALFTGANLTSSVFIRADLTGADFAGATLKNVDLTAANVTGANFEGANLEGAVVCDVDLEVALNLTPAQLQKAKKFKTKGKIYCP